MTLHDDLHDVLTEEASGPIVTTGGWDDVVARGTHRRRINRVRTGIVVAGVAVVVAAGIITIPSSDREGVATRDPDAQVATTMQIDVESARVDGTSVTINMQAPDRLEQFQPCEGQPYAVETDEQVRVEIVSGEGSRSWSYCEASGERATGTFALDAPLASRALIDGWDGTEVAVLGPPGPWIPTWLPAPFDLNRRIEEGQDVATQDGVLAWSLQFPSEEGGLLLSIGTLVQGPYACSSQYVNLRWGDAFYCMVSEDHVRVDGSNGETRVVVEAQRQPGSSEPLPSKQDLIKIANLLERPED